MIRKFQYVTDEERSQIIEGNSGLLLIEEQNITEGNFLIFGTERPVIKTYITVPEEDFELLKQESTLLKAQSKALSDRAEFTDEVIAEMALEIYK
ncbi:hypothetical protein ABIE27_001995 [Paenibacillus sp. 4624]|uniref:hypothetical protein n=1 Tax=Paenibacillus sp. 4624 TaxID=3156453 RepID=UPI003D2011E4